MTTEKFRVVVVSNRLPVTVESTPDGYHMDPSSGGLVTALRPLLKDCAGVWIGWTGTDESPEIERVLGEYSRYSNLERQEILAMQMNGGKRCFD
jgi:trehalose-6-phosphate synthase